MSLRPDELRGMLAGKCYEIVWEQCLSAVVERARIEEATQKIGLSERRTRSSDNSLGAIEYGNWYVVVLMDHAGERGFRLTVEVCQRNTDQ